jgi:transcriptional regulator with XRE-family HTH domain
MVHKNNYIEEINKFIGEKIYSLRLAQGLSRGQLSKVIGVTQQQLQKYEKGINRISVGRLVLISRALDKGISYFYEDIEVNNKKIVTTHHQRLRLEVVRNFMKIKNTEHQTTVNKLIRSLLASSARAT